MQSLIKWKQGRGSYDLKQIMLEIRKGFYKKLKEVATAVRDDWRKETFKLIYGLKKEILDGSKTLCHYNNLKN